MFCSNSAPLQRSSTRSLVSTSRSWRRSPAQPNRTLGRNFENLPRRSHVTPDQCTTRSETKTVDNVHTQFRPPAIRLRRRHLKEIMAAKTTVTWSGMRLWGTSGAVLLSSAAPTPPVRHRIPLPAAPPNKTFIRFVFARKQTQTRHLSTSHELGMLGRKAGDGSAWPNVKQQHWMWHDGRGCPAVQCHWY